MSMAIGNVPHVARPNTMRNHLIVLEMKAFRAPMGSPFLRLEYRPPVHAAHDLLQFYPESRHQSGHRFATRRAIRDQSAPQQEISGGVIGSAATSATHSTENAVLHRYRPAWQKASSRAVAGAFWLGAD